MNTLFEKSDREMLHSKRVSAICGDIAVTMGFDEDDVKQIRLAGLMHDIGKIDIDNHYQ
ncbi:HD domain-containing protein [Dehalobacter sp. DCM]|uniref:HD domain-containing protein n=1 Tax=Dehalobacter sp. DCM TaxID=2907827 RepID=UPI00308139CC|nr:HD domain-containing protein [Dehalobacter sp. DCM]